MRSVPPDGTIVALDAMTFVYLFEKNPAYLPASERLFERISSDRIVGVCSTLVLTEILVPYYVAGQVDRARKLAGTVRGSSNLACVAVDGAISSTAARLRAAYNLRTPDAVHVATALARGADWFVTNDRRLRRVEPEGIRVWLFDDNVSTKSR